MSIQLGFTCVWARHAVMQPNYVTSASGVAVTGLLQQACSLSCSLTHHNTFITSLQQSPGLGLVVLQTYA